MKKVINLALVFTLALGFLQSCGNKEEEKKPWTDKEAMIEALRWQEAHPIHAKAPTDWTNGAYYIGVFKAHQSTQDTAYLNALVAMSERNKWQPWERFFHADDLTICAPYLYLKSIGVEGVDLAPTDTIIHQHLFNPHEWKTGEKKMQKILWWWCDALFMTPPVLAMYADQKNDTSYLNQMHKYYTQTYDLLFDKEENLFARDLHYVWKGDSTDVKEANGKKVFWARGNGWVIGGLALVLDKMPKDYEHRPFYVDLYKTLSNRIKELQHEDGLWRTSLLCPESFKDGEVSASGFYTFAMAWGVNNGILDKATFLPVVTKGWEAIRKCQKEDGMVGFVQNIGASPEPANADSWQNYGTGAFLLAGSEMIKLTESAETETK